jgi:hypothetical protein
MTTASMCVGLLFLALLVVILTVRVDEVDLVFELGLLVVFEFLVIVVELKAF